MTTGTGLVCGVRITHDEATVDDLEAAGVESQREAAERLAAHPAVEEALAIRTCNRVEGYVVADTVEAGRDALSLVVGDADPAVAVEMGHEESLRHLLRVAAGLESLVLGEDQVLGQVRDAFEDARSVGAIGPVLDDAVTKAIRVGERARTETPINEGVLSLASAAVRLADRETDLSGATALVVGAGEMGTLAAEALAERVDRVLVANRTVPHAAHVADRIDVDASAVALDALEPATRTADVVITATGSPEHVVDADTLEAAGETFVVDLAQPRDVPHSAAAIDAVTVRDLDTLEAVTDATRRQREAAAGAVESIVDEEFERLLTQYKRKRADRVISAMYESADRVKAQELQTARAKLDLDEDGEAILESMADAIVSQLLAAPTTSLRDAAEEDDWSTIHTALELFDPEFGPGADQPPSFVADMQPDEIPEGMREEMPAAVLEQLEDD
jgi:glutamyl-tRNA reductase